MRSHEIKSLIQWWKGVVGAKRPHRIWLTLDDGPHPVCTDQILSVLDHHRIKATFFVIGQKVERDESALRRAFDAGHRIGNHTYSHKRLTELSSEDVFEELARTDRLISRYTGGEKIFRPPFGASDKRTDEIVERLGYRTVMWDVDPHDWDPAFQSTDWIDKAIQQIRRRRHAVILNHDNRPTTAEHFDSFIRQVKAIGPVTFEPPSTL